MDKDKKNKGVSSVHIIVGGILVIAASVLVLKAFNISNFTDLQKGEGDANYDQYSPQVELDIKPDPNPVQDYKRESVVESGTPKPKEIQRVVPEPIKVVSKKVTKKKKRKKRSKKKTVSLLTRKNL